MSTENHIGVFALLEQGHSKSAAVTSLTCPTVCSTKLNNEKGKAGKLGFTAAICASVS